VCKVSGKTETEIPARWAPVVALLLLLLHPGHASALDASLLAGTADTIETDETSYAWQIDFRHDFESPFAVSASWINEGHYRDHHRDGLAGQIWGHIPLRNNKVSIAFGAGAYRYFDTKPQPGGDHNNAHGTAPIYSLSASYFTETPWLIRFTANHIHPPGQIDTNSFLLGLGYRLGREPVEKTPEPPSGTESPPRNAGVELTPFLGGTIHNSLESRAGIAGGIEYRRGFYGNFDWTLSGIYEDNEQGIRRTGMGSQVWLVDSFLRRRLTLGIGAGLYTFYDRKPPHEIHSPIDVAGLVTLTAGYRFAGHWIARFNWNRTMTGNDRDSDIFVLGAGYRWNE